MPCKIAVSWLALVVLGLIVCNTPCFAMEIWFNQQVTWKYGKEGLEWKTALTEPRGHENYQLALRPLWALEGGIVAIEIAIARPAQPEVNLLGERQNGVEYPYVITVEELQKGVAKSKFGAVRNFQVDKIVLRVRIERFRLGRGVGDCQECKNIQELSMRISVETTTRGTARANKHWK